MKKWYQIELLGYYSPADPNSSQQITPFAAIKAPAVHAFHLSFSTLTIPSISGYHLNLLHLLPSRIHLLHITQPFRQRPQRPLPKQQINLLQTQQLRLLP